VIVLTCAQGSAEWMKARLGIPTASQFEKILTPGTRKPSTQATGYMMSLLAEWLIGVPAETEVSQFMERGTLLEPQARKRYSYERDVDVTEIGAVLRDDRLVAASPDGLVGKEGTLEIKCPSAAGHVRNLLEGMGGYFGQVQGALWLTGRSWTDLVSFHPDLPLVVTRIERDEDFIASLDAAVSMFVERMLHNRNYLLSIGCTPEERLLVPCTMVKEDPF
jgi:YqaJ-like recombinase protein